MRGIRSIFAISMLLVAGALAAPGQPTGPPTPAGEWQIAKGYAHVRIVNCGERLWGVVSWEARPGGIDRNNPDRNLQNRPTLGMPILLGMVQTRPNRWEGQIYNSQDGHTYSASISLANPDTLRVEGCFLAILCGGENWSRVQPTANVQMAPQSPSRRATDSHPPLPAGPASVYETESDSDVCLGIFGPARLAH